MHKNIYVPTFYTLHDWLIMLVAHIGTNIFLIVKLTKIIGNGVLTM